jgi:hypothetical protein
MRKRKLQILIGIIAALVVAAFFYGTREKDPVYQGKRFSEYLAKLSLVSYSYGFTDQPPQPTFHLYESDPGFAAVDMVGTNALPLLVRSLQNKESSLGLWVRTRAPQLPLIGRLFRTDRRQPRFLRLQAAAAFYRLGPRAAPAIPDIIPLLDDPECAFAAVSAIAHIRPTRARDIVSLTNVLRIPSPEGPLLQSYALLTLSTFGTNASGALPVLVGCLSSTNAVVRGAAAAALARIGAPSDQVVSLMIQSLSPSNPPLATRVSSPPVLTSRSAMVEVYDQSSGVLMTLWALGEYGTNARAALPAISNLFTYRGANSQNVHARARETAAKILADTNSVPR